jgi:predicted transcriptional regulator
MQMSEEIDLSRRERQIMDVIYAQGKASATDVLDRLPDPPSRTAVRTLLGILEEKGHLTHKQRGREYVYQPTRPRKRVGRSALRRVVDTFFDGSLHQAMAAHLNDPRTGLSEKELGKLADLIREVKERGK